MDPPTRQSSVVNFHLEPVVGEERRNSLSASRNNGGDCEQVAIEITPPPHQSGVEGKDRLLHVAPKKSPKVASSASVPSPSVVENPNAEIVVAYKQASQTISLHLDDASLSKLSTALAEGAVLNALGSAGSFEDEVVHIVEVATLLQALHTNLEDGKTDVDRAHNRPKNVLSPPKEKHWIWRLLEVTFGGFNWLLLLIAVIDILSWKPLGENPGPPNPVNWYVGVVLCICVVINSMFNAYQLRKTSNIMASFKNLIPTQCMVLRSGHWSQLEASELQVGDIVRVEIGQKVPADMRLISVANLKVDNSMLTGESEAISCSTKCTSKNYLETRNLVFFGSSVAEGEGVGVVVTIGDATVMGRVSALTGATKKLKTTLQIEVDRFVNIILCLIVLTGIVAILVWVLWLRVDYPNYMTYQTLIANMAAFTIGYTPEGLPIAVVMALSIVARRMAKHNVLVKDLAIIETFNTISLICSDKTGTLTLNQMHVRCAQWGVQHKSQQLAVHDAEMQHPSHEKSVVPEAYAALKDLFRCAALCNKAERLLLNGVQTIKGDASDTALFKWCDSVVDVVAYRRRHPTAALLPFNSRNKFMLAVVQVPASDEDVDTNESRSPPPKEPMPSSMMLLMKGAPEIVLARCRLVLADDGSTREITPEELTGWNAAQETMAKRGERVLGFAFQKLDSTRYPVGHIFNLGEEEGQFTDLVFAGMVSLVDPPRAEVPAAIAKCRSAHIRVAMVTGDHHTTAAAIGEKIGLLSLPDRDSFVVKTDGAGLPHLVLHTNGSEIGVYQPTSVLQQARMDEVEFEVASLFKDGGELLQTEATMSGPMSSRIARGIIVTGAQIPLFDRAMWNWVLRHEELVFARTTPEQKLKIVTEAQRTGDMVAVTGDGVNDAPALRRANIGIAMNGGSEVAREAAHALLVDNNFNSIVTAIELGRTVFDNLRKVIIYLLPAGTWSEMLTILVSIFFGVPSMLSAFLMIVICTCTDVMVSVALVNETAEEDIMTRHPRRKDERLIDAKLMMTAYFTTGTFMFCAASINFFWYCSEFGLTFWGVFWAWSWGDGWYGLSADQLAEIVNVGQSIFFVTLVIMQFGNSCAVRTRRVSILQHNPLWGPHRNWYLPLGMVLALLTVFLVTLAPFFQNTFLTRAVPIKFGLVACAWAVFLVLWDEARKYIVRNYPNSFVAKAAW